MILTHREDSSLSYYVARISLIPPLNRETIDQAMSIRIQQVSPRSEDVQALIKALDEFQGQLYPPESNYHDSLEELSGDHVYFVGAYEGSGILACGAVKVMGDYGEVKRMFVRPGARGLRLGQRILAELEGFARSRRLVCTRLETGIRHENALVFYERCGYKRIGPYGAYSNDPLSVFMEKDLRAGSI
jgi:putative acetyltransferase